MSKHKIILNCLSSEQQLQQFLFTQLSNFNTVNLFHFTENNNSVPLFRLPKIDSMTYRCAIAFQLSRHSSLSLITLALEFFDNIQPLPTPITCIATRLHFKDFIKVFHGENLEFLL